MVHSIDKGYEGSRSSGKGQVIGLYERGNNNSRSTKMQRVSPIFLLFVKEPVLWSQTKPILPSQNYVFNVYW